MENKCVFCGRSLTGRSDKKFCNDKCKNAYHNRLNSKSRAIRNRITTALNCNYRILDALICSGKNSADLMELEQNGFKPSCVTGHRKGCHGHDEYNCFDICYCQTGSKLFRIRRAELLLGSGLLC